MSDPKIMYLQYPSKEQCLWWKYYWFSLIDKMLCQIMVAEDLLKIASVVLLSWLGFVRILCRYCYFWLVMYGWCTNDRKKQCLGVRKQREICWKMYSKSFLSNLWSTFYLRQLSFDFLFFMLENSGLADSSFCFSVPTLEV